MPRVKIALVWYVPRADPLLMAYWYAGPRTLYRALAAYTALRCSLVRGTAGLTWDGSPLAVVQVADALCALQRADPSGHVCSVTEAATRVLAHLAAGAYRAPP